MVCRISGKYQFQYLKRLNSIVERNVLSYKSKTNEVYNDIFSITGVKTRIGDTSPGLENSLSDYKTPSRT